MRASRGSFFRVIHPSEGLSRSAMDRVAVPIRMQPKAQSKNAKPVEPVLMMAVRSEAMI